MFLKCISLLNYAETKKWSYKLFFQIIQDFIIAHVSTFSELFLKLQVTFLLPCHFTLHGHFGISCKANLMVTNSFSFVYLRISWFLLHLWRTVFFLGCFDVFCFVLFSFWHFEYTGSLPSGLQLLMRNLDNLIVDPCVRQVPSCFQVSFFLSFESLVIMFLDVVLFFVLLGVYLMFIFLYVMKIGCNYPGQQPKTLSLTKSLKKILATCGGTCL